MKWIITFKTIKARLTFWLLIVAVLPLIVTGIIISQQRVRVIKANSFEKLTTIRDLKVRQLNLWLDERIKDIKIISEDNEIRAISKIFNATEHTENDILIFQTATALLTRYVEKSNVYDEVFIINAHSKQIELSTNKARIGSDKSHDKNFTEPMRTQNIYIKDIYYSETTRKPAMTFSIPIHDKEKSGVIAGILVVGIDLELSLYDLLQNRTGMGNTGETLIVNKEGIALNELRWYPNAPLKLKIEATPVLMASQGKTGITETVDYRGEPILAAYTYLPRTQWGFVAKQDLKEVYEPVRAMLLNILIVVVVCVIFVYLLAFLVARNFARPVQEMTKVSRRMQEGDLSARNHIMGEDELGLLAQSFNYMAGTMESQILIQKSVADLSMTMVASRGMQDFAGELLKKLIETTGSSLGAFHLLTEDGKEFKHITSIGISPELLEPFDATAHEGELGRVVAAGKISWIKDIPEDTVFKFKTFTGTLLPKEIITTPLMVDDKVVAVISLASLNPYSTDSIKILDQAWMAMNMALSNLMAGEKTERLADELGQKNYELEAQSEELQSQSDELRQTAEELQEQNLELELQGKQVEEANRLKSEFLSNMSHELRTPLNSVMALSRVLIRQAEDKLSEEELNYLKVIARNGQNLLALINDILDLAKIEAGNMNVSLKLFPLGYTVETIMERLAPIAEEKGIEMHLNIPDDLPKIESDEVRVHQILQNIIGNAVKFTTKGSVTASARSDGENIHIEVVDTGIGIAKKDLPYIFQEFRQVDGSSARAYEGTGLGLAIASRAARVLGGELRVQSVLGKGSKFTLTLPIRRPDIMPEFRPVVPTAPIEIAQSRKIVLVVDDAPDVAALIAAHLIREGYDALTATSGKQALELAANHRPFAITLDIVMPDMDGWEVLQSLKENPDTKDIPVIIISIADDREVGFALGAVGYITKPVNKDVLLAEINNIGGSSMHTVLVADDNMHERREMAKIIEQGGMRAIIADGGVKCMEMITATMPDLLILDLIMPDMDGFEVLERVRSDPATRDLPVIVVTAKELTAKDREKLTGKVSLILAKSETTSTALLEEIKKILGNIEKCHKYPESGKLKTVNRILLVEDNEAAVIQVKSVLESEGYGVDVARGGQEALEYVKDKIPDGIILDLMMPEVDGFEVLKNIRSQEATAKVPVLILTAKDLTAEDLKTIKNNNIKQLIQKGDVDREDLLVKVKSMLGEKTIAAKEISDPKPVSFQAELVQTRQQEPARARKTAGRSTILVIEDNPDNMISIKAVLNTQYTILEAADGEEGLKKALTKGPDLILLDMFLPGMDGFAVAGKLKEEDKTRHIPIIAVTAKAMKGDREKILEAGCDDYMSKPIDPEEVLKKIENWLRKLK